VTPESIAAVEALVMENRRVSVDEIAEILNMSHGSAHHVIQQAVQQEVHEWLRRQPKEFFLEESINFVNAGGPVLNEMETM
jgi:ATP-dependent Lon protease